MPTFSYRRWNGKVFACIDHIRIPPKNSSEITNNPVFREHKITDDQAALGIDKLKAAFPLETAE